MSYAERVAHRAGATVNATLEHDDDPTTRYVVLPLCFGHLRSQEPRRFTAVVHAASPVVVATAPCPRGVQAAALAQLAGEHGERSPLLQDNGGRKLEVVILRDEPGFVIVAENALAFPVTVEVDATGSVGVLSSRGASLYTQDLLPPRSRMVVMVLSREEGPRDKQSCGFRYNGAAAPPGSVGSSHVPELAPENADLHTVMNMDKERVAADALTAALAAAMGGGN